MKPARIFSRTRRALFGALSVTVATLAAAPLSAAAAYPDHTITIVVPFPAGGGPDIIARALADALYAEFKQPAVVQNRDGAGTVIGVNAVAKAPPDGYTLLVSGDAAVINAVSGRKLPYDLQADLKPVSLLFSGAQFLLVRKEDQRFQTLADLVREGKANPGRLKFGSSGQGSSLHMSAEIFNRAAQIDGVHVPYRGVGRAMTDLAGGQIDYMIAGASSALPVLNQGMYRVLAATGRSRAPQLPEVPTLIEQGVDAETGSWYGLFVPAATPDAIVQQLNAAVVKALNSKPIAERMHQLGGEARPTTTAQAVAFVKGNLEKFRGVIKDRGLKLDE